ncbi:AAA family ATPase [Lysobacter sp. CA199]|uniref:ATP-binding protein n=1 Tax=Lysobacter sp. CA199 TaxID=3455608 RepID=UPI003F8D3B4D
MRLPKLDDLIEEQMKVYEHPHDRHLFVVGPPGSGKTTLAVMRANFIVNTGQNVLVITRNKLLVGLATQLAREALGGDEGFGASTMHQFASKHYYDNTGNYAPEPSPFNYDWVRIIADYQQRGITPHIEHVLIDEGQNLPAGFFEWIVRFVAKVVTVFADENQTTSAGRASILDIYRCLGTNPVLLSVNHRNTREIARLAEYFHRAAQVPPATVARAPSGDLPRLARFSGLDALTAAVALHYRNRGGSVGLIVRRMDEVQHLTEGLARTLGKDVRVEGYVSAEPQGHDRIRTMDRGVTVLTGESAIGLEFNTVFLQDLERSLPATEVVDARRMYMLCARARDILTLVDGPDALPPHKLSGLPGPDLLQR